MPGSSLRTFRPSFSFAKCNRYQRQGHNWVRTGLPTSFTSEVRLLKKEASTRPPGSELSSKSEWSARLTECLDLLHHGTVSRISASSPLSRCSALRAPWPVADPPSPTPSPIRGHALRTCLRSRSPASSRSAVSCSSTSATTAVSSPSSPPWWTRTRYVARPDAACYGVRKRAGEADAGEADARSMRAGGPWWPCGRCIGRRARL